jgi:dTDP-glucose pyrophosphorylase
VTLRRNVIDERAPVALRTNESVRDALQRLQGDPFGVAVVTGPDGGVVGALADAHLRLAMVEAGGSSPVERALPVTPMVASPDDPDGSVADMLSAFRVSALPVVQDGKVLGLRLASEFPGAGPPAPTAVVMAGGRGQRLRPLTDKVPKPLLRIGRSSIVERIIGALAAAGVREVVLTVNYKADAFEERLGSGEGLGVRLRYVRERQALGTAGGLAMLPEPPDGPVLVTNGDIMTRLDFVRLLDYHWNREAAATMAAVEHVAKIPYAVVRTDGSRLLGLEEKPEIRALCNAGIYVLEPQVLALVEPGERLDMPDLFTRAVDGGLPVHVFPVVEKWFDIGSPEEFERVLMEFATGEEE